jgi:phage portal protein BeeE
LIEFFAESGLVMLNKLKKLFVNNQDYHREVKSYYYDMGKAVWSDRNYNKFAEEGYCKNVIAYRSINIIAKNAGAVEWQIGHYEDGKFVNLENHHLLNLIKLPNPLMKSSSLIEVITHYLLIAGKCYVLAVKNDQRVDNYISYALTE